MGTGLTILSSQIAICTLRASGRKYYDFLHENSKGGMSSSLTVNRCIEEFYPSRTRYLLDILKTKSYLPETYLIDNHLVTYCHLLKISFLNIHIL
jgi:hypothetical protein